VKRAWSSRGPGRRFGFVLAAVGAVGTIGLVGCAAIGIEPNTFQTSPLPAISDDQASSVLAAMDTTVNDANAARDPELLATVYADPLLGIDAAGYALDATADPENGEPLPEIEHTDPTIFVPRFDSYPQWFVTAASVRPNAPLRLEVHSRDASAAPWITSMSTDLLAGVEFPELALDEAGYVIGASDQQLAALPSTAEELAAAHVATLGEADDGSTGALSFAEEAWTTARQASDAQRGVAVAEAADVQVAYEVTDVLPQAVETADGGALVFYALAEDVVYQVRPTYFLQLDEATAAFVGTAEITTNLTERWAIQLAVYLPPTAGGEPRVIAARVDRVALSGT
jgi:hypothetical protein